MNQRMTSFEYVYTILIVASDIKYNVQFYLNLQVFCNISGYIKVVSSLCSNWSDKYFAYVITDDVIYNFFMYF